MLDFVKISVNTSKKPAVIKPEFMCTKKSGDLLVKGRSLYGIWDENEQKWFKTKSDAARIIDDQIHDWFKEQPDYMNGATVLYLDNYSSGMYEAFLRFVSVRDDTKVRLDSKVVFKSDPYKKTDYSTHRLDYDPVEMETPGYDKLMSTLYLPEERAKIEWLVGAVLAGENHKVQKFAVLYGEPKTGKSTVLNIIEMLFDGYCSHFDAAALGNKAASFALEPFKNNPLVGIQHDGDLSRIDTNVRLNSIVSHEMINVNEKFKGIYETRFDTILFIGSNSPVRISDAKSGLLRRLIDVHPSGKRLSIDEYEKCMKQIKFELGGIAYRCRELYLSDPSRYNKYRPTDMMESTNDFYDFVLSYYDTFASEEYVTLKTAWERYKAYVEEANVMFRLSMRAFGNELKNYFEEYISDKVIIGNNGEHKHVRSVYIGLRTELFKKVVPDERIVSSYSGDKEAVKDIFEGLPDWLRLRESSRETNIFGKAFSSCLAQYATKTENETPKKKWENVNTTLSDILPTEVHYVLTQDVMPSLVVIDFDRKDKDGNKSLRLNLEAAEEFPRTYAEVSKGGQGLHLHYIYDGDVNELSRLYDDNIEIKVFTGKSALRRRLSLCNSEQIAHISSGLPLRGDKGLKMINWDTVKNEKAIRTIIRRNLAKEYHADTTSSVHFIKKTLDDAYASGVEYDVRDLRPAVMNFAAAATNQSEHCMSLVMEMPFCSEEKEEVVVERNETEHRFDNKDEDKPIIFYDVEVFPNLFVICWKKKGSGGKESCVKMINPTANEVSEFIEMGRLVGFNNRDYDNHILYARILGQNEAQLYKQSQMIIEGSPNAKFREAYGLSYTDVYDFSNTKQSLKKWEIELGIHHQELGLRWDQPVPKELWEKVADYCCNDVVATEAVFDYLKEDWEARQILASISGLSVNEKTNKHSARIIFGKNKHPQSEFIYTDLSKEFPGYEFSKTGIDPNRYVKDEDGKPIKVNGKSIYMGEDPSEGGYVFARPGIWFNVVLLDISSLHPTTIENLNLFGDRYTARYSELKRSRIAVKHKEWDEARTLLGGALAPILEGIESKSKEDQQEFSDGLAYALKIVINSVYGCTSASFENEFKDPRNIDNIVAKRGALFMIKLKNEVEARGFAVAHVKTDSIKIPNANEEIINFVIDFGKQYGYSFEHEATYAKMCLVNDAVYVAKYDEYGERTKGGRHANEWTATGAQFKVPYVFKTLFSHEGIEFTDMCETKSTSGDGLLYLDMDENYISEREGIEASKTRFEKEHAVVQFTASGSKKKVFDFHELTGTEKLEYDVLCDEIKKLHNYQFVGKCGSFCPIVPGKGGGVLLRESKGKYSAVTGTKGFRWLEAETVMANKCEADIDKTYYRELVDKAYNAIAKYGDAEEFING